ncbi:MAG: DMT family transporter [Rhizobiaceae bacterium]|nr:DMT family transporter [Rhizobiaceae bacterium]
MSGMNRAGLGISLRVLSGLLAAGMFVCVKAVSNDIPLGEIVFFRSFFAIIPLIIFLWWRKEFPHGLATKRPFDHLMRSGFGALSLFLAFAAISRLNLAEALLIAQLSPVIMAVAAVIILRERLTIWRVGGLALGFSGVITLVGPDLLANAPNEMRLEGYVFGLLSAALAAFALIMVRSLNKTESPGAIALYFVIASMTIALFTIPWGWVLPSGSTLIFLVMAGLFGGFAHITMTLGFKYAEASRLAPFEYLALLWPLLADLLIFKLPLSTTFLLAAPLVLSGAALAAMEGSWAQRRVKQI